MAFSRDLLQSARKQKAVNNAPNAENRNNAGYKCANQEAFVLMRQGFNQSGDIDTTEAGCLTITLDPLPTTAKAMAAAELCAHLSNTKTCYPGTNPILNWTALCLPVSSE